MQRIVFFKKSYLLLCLMLSFPLFSADFYERLTPEARELYNSLDEEHKKRARELGESMSNAVQATFRAAQEEIAHGQTLPQHSQLNAPSPPEKKTKRTYNPTQGPTPPKPNDRNKHYVQSPGILRH
jgi:hypothetical protein